VALFAAASEVAVGSETLGNRSIYQIKTTSGEVVTVFAQSERRTSQAAIDWSDEVFVSWSADAAVLLQS
jgi:hypothetical protein